jgi:hypothetical protein
MLLLLAVPLACTTNVEPPPRAFVTKMVLEEGQDSFLECNTGTWTGRITIVNGVKVGYRNVTTSSAAGAESKTTLTVDDTLMTVEKDGLRFGTDTRVPLRGESAVEVKKDGVYVAGAKVASLPAK